MAVFLEVDGLSAGYGRTEVLHGISFQVQAGAITTILGANGAGKSTTLRAVTGLVKSRGTIKLQGQSLVGMAAEAIVRLGVAHVVEGRGTFMNLTVAENLKLGAYSRKDKAGIARDFERVYGYFPRLRERHLQLAGTLSGGEQQMLAVARGLMLRPRLLLLDEPSFGLAPLVVAEIFRIVKQVNTEERVSVLLVEQNAATALELASAAYLMETGRMVMSGPPAIFQKDDSVRRAYLGY
jgi:branched-chain amino acid transport system ATP-binding protein